MLTATDGISVTGRPKQPDGLNQVSVIGNDSIAPDGFVLNINSRSVKTIAGKLGTDAWMADQIMQELPSMR